MALPDMRVRITADTADAEGGFDRVAQSADRVGSATDRMAQRIGAASRQLTNTGRSTSSLGRGFQNLGFQVNDFAVQVGAGTAASVALSQQLPQLLQGFGLVGVALSLVAAVGIPVVKMLVSASEGAKLTSDQFGSLEPAILSVVDGFKAFKKDVGEALKVVGENLDRILTTAGTVAAFFVGRWVVGAVAARVATMSVTASLVALRGALIRTGFGAAAILVGEFVYQLTTASSWVRNLGIQLGILSASTVKELTTQQTYLQKKLAENDAMIIASAKKVDAATNGIQRKSREEQLENIKLRRQETAEELAAVEDKIKGYKNLEQVKKSVTLLDLTPEDKKKKKKTEAEKREEERKKEIERQRKHLEEGLKAVRESQMTERQMLFKHLLDRQAILDQAREMELVTDGEHKQLMTDLQAEHFKRLNELEQNKADAEAAKKGADFQRIYDLTKGGLSDQLGAWGGYFQNLAQLSGQSNSKLFAGLKIFAAAESLINAWRAFSQVLADPTLPWYAKIAAAGQVLAAGIGAVTAIQGATQGGGGKKSQSGGGGGGGQAAAPTPLQVRLNGIGASDFISGSQLGTLLDRLDDEAGDRGYKLMVAA